MIAADISNLTCVFEEDAKARQAEFELALWTAADDRSVDLQQANPDHTVPYVGLDRSNIVSTLDGMLGNGIGLELFLRSGDSKESRRPDTTMGSSVGPAIMAYGSAINMFGLPDDPFDLIQQETEPNANSPLVKSMRNCTLSEKPASEFESAFNPVKHRLKRQSRQKSSGW